MLAKQESAPSVGVREVTIHNAAFHELDNGYIVLRGVIDLGSLGMLRTDDYQREVLALNGGKKSSLTRAIADGEVLPDIELGMRGQKFSSNGKDTVILHDHVYIVDGLQRVSALKAYGEANPESPPLIPLGATIHFGTTKQWEKERFRVLNNTRIPVGPSVILRNDRDEHPGVTTLYGLSTNDPEFALYQRVQWNQRALRGELITAMTLAKVAGALHSTSSAVTGTRVAGLAPALDAMADKVGLKNYRDNIKKFFELTDDCWGLRKIEYSKLAVVTKGNFLLMVASVLYKHSNFWEDGRKLKVDANMRAKFKSFPIDDPEIARLSGAGSMAIRILYDLMLEHMNKGRRVNRLRPRAVPRDADEE